MYRYSPITEKQALLIAKFYGQNVISIDAYGRWIYIY